MKLNTAYGLKMRKKWIEKMKKIRNNGIEIRTKRVEDKNDEGE